MDAACALPCGLANSVLRGRGPGRALSGLDRRTATAGAALSRGRLERRDLRRLLHQRLQPSAIRRRALRRQWLPAVQTAGRPAKLALGRQRHRVYGSIRHYAGRRRRGTSGVAVPPLWGGISYLFTFGTSMPSAVARSIW